jgi:iron-sulfur cluster repair protein YtfE (RIC family)
MIEERKDLGGAVDFTMMYVAHDAFTRDLRRIATACARGVGLAPQTRASWTMFAEQLHAHHGAEDAFLWPALRAQPLTPGELQLVDAMESEHAEIDPHLERVADAFSHDDATGVCAGVQALHDGLAAHLRHEENDALPLIASRLGADGWAAVGQQMSQSQGGGLDAALRYLTWVLDDAPAAVERKVLGMLPPAVQELYHRDRGGRTA